jgi:hypothetical protein
MSVVATAAEMQQLSGSAESRPTSFSMPLIIDLS